MAKPRFTSFVMFAEMRTGSNFLEANLNALEGVSCLGELFNPHFIGKKDQTAAFGMTLDEREADPLRLLAAAREQTPGLSGFRYFHSHDARILPALLDDPACAKIILTRNPAESYVSWKIAQATGQWKLTNAKNLKTAQAQFDAAEFQDHLAALQDFQIRLLHALQCSGQTAFYIDYDDIGDVDVLNGLAAFLGVPARLDAPDATLKKQNPEPLAEKVVNFDQMAESLARMDRFNLSRTPNFEPRRAANVPSFLASEAGLLFMPMRGGPEKPVRDWLAALTPDQPLTEDFTQKSLRQWRRAHPGHRSFTVLRHPLLRAHLAFHRQIVSGRAAEHRKLLIRVHKADLPPAGQNFADTAQEREAFLIFLRYVRLGLGGQTSLRVDAHWASQAAVLQGFSGLQPPDLVIREPRLAQGLDYLAAEVGLKGTPAPKPDQAPEKALARIWDAELESAAEDTYARDYAAFGFGRWRD